eukprot:359853-Chlamydomonas_euryale.AAC.18
MKWCPPLACTRACATPDDVWVLQLQQQAYLSQRRCRYALVGVAPLELLDGHQLTTAAAARRSAAHKANGQSLKACSTMQYALQRSLQLRRLASARLAAECAIGKPL